jgi:hypothetical protein
MTHRVGPAFLLIVAATLCSAGIARWCMSSGIGVSPDSVVYLNAADSLLAGRGLRSIPFHFTPTLGNNEPLVSFPPTYPLLLALSGSLSTDRLNGAMWLHSILFAANLCLVGVIVSLATARSVWAVLCAILLFLSSTSLLEIHTMAWSEPPFIFFLLLSVLLLLLHLRQPNYALLVGSSLAVGLAVTTRYAGVTILPPMLLTIFLVGIGRFRSRVRDALILVGLGSLPLAAWLLRNVVEADSATNRSLSFHPIELADYKTIASSLLEFWLPFSGQPLVKGVLLFLCCGVVLRAIVLALRDRVRSEPPAKMNAAVGLLSGLFVITYLLFLIAYDSLADPAVELSSRVFVPVPVFGIILAVSLMHRLTRAGERLKLTLGFLALLLILVSVNFVHTASFAAERRSDGRGFTSREWTDSATIHYLTSLPESRPLFSNAVDATHFLSGKTALRLPAKVDPTNGKQNAEFEREMNTLRNELIENRAVVVYFDKVTWRWYLPTRDELEHVYALPVLVRLDDGVIFGIE